MNTDANNAAAPSSAVTAVADNWDEHGTPIVTKQSEPPKKSEESAASAPPAKTAKPEEKSAATGAVKQETKPKAKPSAEERIAELVADRNTHKQRADDLDKRLHDLESKAAPAPKVESKAKEPPKRPNPFTWTGTQEDFDKAMDAYEEYRDSQVAARTRQEQAQTETQKSMTEMLKLATAKHPDAEEKIKTATTEIMSKAPLFVQSFVNDSEVLGDLLYTLADTTTLNNLLDTAKTNPGKALRVLRDMELDISKALVKPEAKSEEKAPEPKPRAPKPPSEVGGRGAATEDAATAAARDGNFSAFDAAQWGRHAKAS
jgi:hypothetical protein